MNRLVRAFAVAVVTISLSACSAPKLFTTPEYGQVKKIAIVSFIVNNDVHRVGGDQNPPPQTGGKPNLSALATLVAKKAISAPLQGVGTKFIEFGHAEFVKELSQVKDWQVMPPEAVIASEDYKAFVLNTTPPRGSSGDGSSTPAGMYNAYYITNYSNKEILEPFGALAKKLGVDGVAIIRLNLGYQVNAAAFGMGTAFASVAAEIKVINQSGVLVAKSSAEFGNDKTAVGRRMNSEQKAPLVAGALVYTGAVEGMFKEAISKNAVFYREELKKI